MRQTHAKPSSPAASEPAGHDPLRAPAAEKPELGLAAPLERRARALAGGGALTSPADKPAADGPPALAGPGTPLRSGVRSEMEQRLGHDFRRVRIHSGAAANRSADELGALAYTAGNDLAFAAGQYRPETRPGQALLAHELTHVVQQGGRQSLQPRLRVHEPGDHHELQADAIAAAFVRSRQPLDLSAVTPVRDSHAALQRSGRTPGGFFFNILQNIPIFGWLARLGAYTEKRLQDYLDNLDKNGEIEGDYHSDDKARLIVRSWSKGEEKFTLTARRKALLILEMLDGHLSNDDQKGILDLLERSESAELEYFFGAGGVKHATLLDNFDGGDLKQLYRFYQRRYSEAYSELTDKILDGGKVEPTKPDVAKLTSGEASPEGDPVQRGDPLPKTSSPFYSAVKSGESTRRSKPPTLAEADTWIQEVYGEYIPADKKSKGKKGYLVENISVEKAHDEAFEDFLYYCHGLGVDVDTCRYEAASTAGFFDRENSTITVHTERQSPTTMLHEAIHAYAHEDIDTGLSRYAKEGLTEYLTRNVAERAGKSEKGAKLAQGYSYGKPYQVMLELSLIVGEPLLAKVHFQGRTKLLCEKLGKDTFDSWQSHMDSKHAWQDAIKVLHGRKGGAKKAAGKEGKSCE